MSVRALAVLALTGCGYIHGALGGGDDQPMIDAAIDGNDVDTMNPEGPDECTEWTAKHFMPCAIGKPLGNLSLGAALSPYTYTTTNGGGVLTDKNGATIPIANQVLTQSGGVMAALASVRVLTIENGVLLNVVGTKPFILVAWDSMSIGGTIDASSTRSPDRQGAGGGGSSLCVNAFAAAPGANEADNGGGSGGGGGGAFQGAGGDAGPGDAGQNAGGGGGDPVLFPMVVRGGCSGAASGTAGPDPQVVMPSDDNTFSAGGRGGGAIQLTARNGITLTTNAIIHAGGAGGEGALFGSAVGGGGGGAGGYIGLQGSSITLTGAPRLIANGGAGGGSAPFQGTGDFGEDASASSTPAAGGAVSSCSNAGGNGSVGATHNGASASQASANCGGGAGGGGAGFIGVFVPTFSAGTAMVSPVATVNPF